MTVSVRANNRNAGDSRSPTSTTRAPSPRSCSPRSTHREGRRHQPRPAGLHRGAARHRTSPACPRAWSRRTVEPLVAKASGTPKPVVGGGGFGDAPVLEPGTYEETILPGEQIFYRVRVDFGQRPPSRPTSPRPGPSSTFGGTDYNLFTVDAWTPALFRITRTGGDPDNRDSLGSSSQPSMSLTEFVPEVRYRNKTVGRQRLPLPRPATGIAPRLLLLRREPFDASATRTSRGRSRSASTSPSRAQPSGATRGMPWAHPRRPPAVPEYGHHLLALDDRRHHARRAASRIARTRRGDGTSPLLWAGLGAGRACGRPAARPTPCGADARTSERPSHPELGPSARSRSTSLCTGTGRSARFAAVDWEQVRARIVAAVRRRRPERSGGDGRPRRRPCSCVAVPPVWQVLRLAVTLVHELGHALVGLAVGRRFTGFVLRGDMSGHAVTVGPARGIGRVLSTWAGYPAPAVVGAAMVWAAGRGWAAPVAHLVLVVLLVALLRVRSLLTAAVMLVAIGCDRRTVVVARRRRPGPGARRVGHRAAGRRLASPRRGSSDAGTGRATRQSSPP